MKYKYLKLVTFSSILVFIGFLFLVSSPNQLSADCYCAGNYCFANCDSCSPPSDSGLIVVSGNGKGSCTNSSICTLTNAGGMSGCSGSSWEYDVVCSECTGGYFDDSLGFNVDTYECVTCGGSPPPPGPPPPPPGPPPPPCAVPAITNISQTCNSDGTKNVTVTWGSVSGASSYKIQVDEDTSYSSPVNVTTSVTSQTFPSINAPGSPRYTHVRVETSNGSCTAPSNYSPNSTISGISCPINAAPTCNLNPGGAYNVCIGDSVGYTGSCTDGNNNLRLVEMFYVDSTLANPAVSDHVKFCSAIVSPVAGSGSCTANSTWSTLGSYYVEVNGTDNATPNLACSSNAWCEWPPNPPNTISCGALGFTDCGANDLATVTVQDVGTPSILPTQYCAGGTTPTNDISWSGVTCGSTYKIFRCVGSGCTPTVEVATTGSTFYADTDIIPGLVYRYRIRGVSASGGYLGSYSNIVTITAPTCINTCSAPILNVAKMCNASYNSDNTWSWNSVPGATSYRLQVDNNSNFSSPEVNTLLLGTSYVQSNVASGVAWNGRVRVESSNSAICTAPSAYSTVKQTDGIPCQGCTVALVPVGPFSMYTGEQQAFQAVVTKFPALATAQKADFQVSSLNIPAPVTISPTTDNTEPFNTTATAANPGTSGVSATVTMSNGIATCTSNTVSITVASPSCTIDLIPDGDSGNPYPLDLGDQVVFTGNVTTSPAGVPITNVTFTSGDGNILTSCPPGACAQVVDTSGPPGNTFNGTYEPGPSGDPLDTVDVSAVATISGGITCPATPTTVEIQDVDAWWQATGGDTLTTNRNDVGLGTLSSEVPDFLDPLLKFINDGADSTSPGMPIMGGTPSGVDQDNVSSESWLPSGDTATGGLPGYDTTNGERYDYAFFSALIPDGISKVDVNNATLSGGQLLTLIDAVQPDDNGYKWVFAKHASGLTINNAFNIAGRKVILFVESATGNLVINGNVAITDGTGFFLAISNNEIRFGPGTTNPMNVEGLYVADTVLDTCSVAPCSNQFRLRGTAVAWSNMVLERDLAASGSNFDTPAEVFTFAPDLIMNYPSTLALPKIQWREVAP